MREVGRLREYTFRAAGGGTGKEMDIDAYDIADSPFKQLIVWSPQDKEIVGGYRFLSGKMVDNIINRVSLRGNGRCNSNHQTA